MHVCPKCSHHFRITAAARIELITDAGTFIETDRDLKTTDPLNFKDSIKYKDRLKKAQKNTGDIDGAKIGEAKINGVPVCLGVMNFQFMGGSMGVVVGEKLARIIERGIEKNLPVIIVSASGGARMQEGIFSLMQMARVTSALTRLSEKKLPYISLLTDPTTGGVAASFSMLGDVIISEPGALIGFAGPRVIEQTIRRKLPEGFQRAEFLLQHGMVDIVVPRSELKNTLSKVVSILAPAN